MRLRSLQERDVFRRVYQKPQKRAKKTFYFFAFLLFLGFCLWVAYGSITASLPSPGKTATVYGNPTQDDLRLTILSAIKKAKKSIYICIYGLSDPAIMRALNERAQKGIAVKILYDSKGSPNLQKKIPLAKASPIFSSAIMHQKVIIIDDEMIFFGSANLTEQSLKMHDNLVLGLCNKELADFLQKNRPFKSTYAKSLVGGQSVEIWLLPDPKGKAIQELKKQIRSAKKTVQIALFTLTHPLLIEEILHAHKRHVEITVILDKNAAHGASKNAVEALKKANIPVYLNHSIQLMHHKLLYIDEKVLVSGSANWTKSAFTKNSDLLFILSHLNEAQKNKVDALWRAVKLSSQPCL